MEKLTLKQLREKCSEMGIDSCGKTKKDIIATLTTLNEPLDDEYESLVRDNDPNLWLTIRDLVSDLPDERPEKTVKKMKTERQDKWRMVYEELVALSRNDEEAEEEQMVAEVINASATRYFRSLLANEDIVRRFFERYPTLVSLYYETNWKTILPLALAIGDTSRLSVFMEDILEMDNNKQEDIFKFIRYKETAEQIMDMVPLGKTFLYYTINHLSHTIKMFEEKESVHLYKIEYLVLSNDISVLSKLSFDYLLKKNAYITAAKHGRLSVLKLLYSMNPEHRIWKMHLRDGPLNLAVKYNHVDLVRWLLPLLEENKESIYVYLFLHSIKQGNEEMTRMFLEKDLPRKDLVRLAKKAAKLGYPSLTLLIVEKIPKLSGPILRDIITEALLHGHNEVGNALMESFKNIITPLDRKMLELTMYNNEDLNL